jgi:AAA+ superfamily predicted ATPase
MSKTVAKSLVECLKARVPGILVKTLEEERLIEALRTIVLGMKRPLFTWSMSAGVSRLGEEPKDDQIVGTPAAGLDVAFNGFTESADPQVLVLLDPQDVLGAPIFQRMLRETLDHARRKGKTIVICGADWKVPAEVADDIHVTTLPLPEYGELLQFITNVCFMHLEQFKGKINVNEAKFPALARACQGLTLFETQTIVSMSLVKYQAIDERSVALAVKEKTQIVERSGAIGYIEPRRSLQDIGGLEHLKEWLVKRGELFSTDVKAKRIKALKGVLLVGVPGTGKSLCAEAVCAAWGKPMLDVDVGAMFGGIVGETEHNLHDALACADAVAPCVMRFDEIEKGLGSGDMDGGTTKRFLQILLKYMSDHTSEVFIIATANKIEALPPEVIRRFDAVFFVDLPNAKAREEIFRIHLGPDADAALDPKLADIVIQSTGLTGSEIETVVNEARIDAHYEKVEVLTDHVLAVIARTIPLSKTMAEQIAKLREFCKSGRARPASEGSIEADAKASTSKLEI